MIPPPPGALVLDYGSTIGAAVPPPCCQVCSSMTEIHWRYKSEGEALHAAYSRTELRLQTSEFIQCIQSHQLPDPCESLRESLFILRKRGILSNSESGLFYYVC